MRVYLPALGSDLSADRPPVRSGFAAAPERGAAPDDIEVLEDDAQTEAALASLELLREAPPGERPSRVVLAADAPVTTEGEKGASRVVRVEPGTLGWGDVAAFLIDEDGAAEAVRAVLRAGDQGAADRAVADLWEHPLEWFDISERDALAAAWFPGRRDRG
jgi:hypothetical protein